MATRKKLLSTSSSPVLEISKSRTIQQHFTYSTTSFHDSHTSSKSLPAAQISPVSTVGRCPRVTTHSPWLWYIFLACKKLNSVPRWLCGGWRTTLTYWWRVLCRRLELPTPCLRCYEDWCSDSVICGSFHDRSTQG